MGKVRSCAGVLGTTLLVLAAGRRVRAGTWCGSGRRRGDGYDRRHRSVAGRAGAADQSGAGPAPGGERPVGSGTVGSGTVGSGTVGSGTVGSGARRFRRPGGSVPAQATTGGGSARSDVQVANGRGNAGRGHARAHSRASGARKAHHAGRRHAQAEAAADAGASEAATARADELAMADEAADPLPEDPRPARSPFTGFALGLLFFAGLSGARDRARDSPGRDSPARTSRHVVTGALARAVGAGEIEDRGSMFNLRSRAAVAGVDNRRRHSAGRAGRRAGPGAWRGPGRRAV